MGDIKDGQKCNGFEGYESWNVLDDEEARSCEPYYPNSFSFSIVCGYTSELTICQQPYPYIFYGNGCIMCTSKLYIFVNKETLLYELYLVRFQDSIREIYLERLKLKPGRKFF